MDKQTRNNLRKLVAINKLAPSSGSLLDCFNNRIDHIPFNSDEGISRIACVYLNRIRENAWDTLIFHDQLHQDIKTLFSLAMFGDCGFNRLIGETPYSGDLGVEQATLLSQSDANDLIKSKEYTSIPFPPYDKEYFKYDELSERYGTDKQTYDEENRKNSIKKSKVNGKGGLIIFKPGSIICYENTPLSLFLLKDPFDRMIYWDGKFKFNRPIYYCLDIDCSGEEYSIL